MSLSEKFAAAQAEKSSKIRCAVALTREEMGEEDRAHFDAALTNLALSGALVSSVLKSEGYDLSAFSVRRHRRKECSC